MKKSLQLLGAVLLLTCVSLAQSNLRYDTNFVAYNTKLCFESASGTGIDICLKRAGAGQLSIEKADGTSATLLNGGVGGAAGTLGTYQGTTSVPITGTSFTALIAAASDIKIPANASGVAGKRLTITAHGVYTTAAASLLNAEVMLCQVSGCASGTVVAPAGCAIVSTNQANVLANGQFTMECYLTSTATVGASGTYMAKAVASFNLGAATTAVQSYFADAVTAVSAAVDETKDEFVNIAFKFTTGNAGNSATLHDASVSLSN
jgi:hypothetical protein